MTKSFSNFGSELSIKIVMGPSFLKMYSLIRIAIS